MFGIDSPELLVIAIVALVVIGPKELPSLLRTWGKWMAQMRGMASEFRGHVDEMVRQSELDEVKKQLQATPGLDLQALNPAQQIKQHIQEGIAEGEKAFNEAKASFDNPLAEPESAPQIAAEPTPAAETASETPPVASSEPLAADLAAVEPTAIEPAPVKPAVIEPAATEMPAEPKPTKAAAE